MKQQIKEILLENQHFNPGKIMKREHMEIPLNTGMIVCIVGARRSGKTFLLYYLIDQLKKGGISSERIIFINFEDERLNLKQTELDLIVQAYLELYPDVDIKQCYFFFDEIQNVKGWEKFIRRMFDTKSKNLFITGSNSRLLSTEIATGLRGRTVSYTLFPYSFAEFVKYTNGPANFNTQASRAKLINLTEKFMTEGGFPELLNFDRPFKTKVLQEYFNVMIYRDIIERYTVSNPEVLKFFIKKIFSAVTGPLSVNKTYNDLKSMGYKISNKYLYEYLDYCNTVFLTQSIRKFDFSEIKQAKSDKKVYIIDNGLLSAIDFNVSENKGKLMENLVAMELLKQGNTLYYFKEHKECDFIVQHHNDQKFLPMQVSLSLKLETTRTREIKGLVAACQYLKVDEGIIITMDEEETFTTSTGRIRVIPFYKYFTLL